MSPRMRFEQVEVTDSHTEHQAERRGKDRSILCAKARLMMLAAAPGMREAKHARQALKNINQRSCTESSLHSRADNT